MSSSCDSEYDRENDELWRDPSVFNSLGHGPTLAQEDFWTYPKQAEELHPSSEPLDTETLVEAGRTPGGITNAERRLDHHKLQTCSTTGQAANEDSKIVADGFETPAGIASPGLTGIQHKHDSVERAMPANDDGPQDLWQAQLPLGEPKATRPSADGAMPMPLSKAPLVSPSPQPSIAEQGPWHLGYDSSPQRRIAVDADVTLTTIGLLKGLGIAPLKCTHRACVGHRFWTEKDLDQHNEEFENERKHRYKCDICGKGSKDPKDLRRHKLTHKEPELPCSTCGRLFRRNDQLARHNGTCKGPGTWSPSPSTRGSKRTRGRSDTSSIVGSVISSPFASFPSGSQSNMASLSSAPQMRRTVSDTRPTMMTTPAYGQAQTSRALTTMQISRTHTAFGAGPSTNIASSLASSSPMSQAPDIFSPAVSPLPQATPPTVYTPLYQETKFDFYRSVEEDFDAQDPLSPSLHRKRLRH